jgi:hypothetical protein
MSDATLRALERRWRATGDVEDEAAFLLQRVRAGGLCDARLDLAAYCGHDAAVRARPPARSQPRWFEGLSRWGEEVELRAAVHAMEAAVEDDELVARRALDAVQAWRLCPCEKHLGQARDAGMDAVAAAREAWGEERGRIVRAAGLVALALARWQHPWFRVAPTGSLAPWCGAGLTEVAGLRPRAERAARERLAAWALCAP